MPTLTQAILDMADCNTTFVYSNPDFSGPMPFGSEDGYRALYERLVGAPEEGDLHGETAILRRLKPAFHGNAYWRSQLAQSYRQAFPGRVWERLVPVEARLKPRLEVVDAGSVEISPVPTVVLYPFGWSTWLSFLVKGSFTLEQLADLLEHLFKHEAFILRKPEPNESEAGSKPEPRPLRLVDLFGRIGEAVLKDVFDQRAADLWTSSNVLHVTTVLEKYGGTPQGEEDTLRRIVSPGRPPQNVPFTTIQVALPRGRANDFVLQDGHGVLLWAEHLLETKGRAFSNLRCYHNNSFRSLLQAWQLSELLNRAKTVRKPAPLLSDWAQRALCQLEEQTDKADYYRNYTLMRFLARPGLQKILSTAREAFPKP